ncbi:TPA: restriction endonuclease subunit S [Clostridioides difficile]|uniref:Type I restriction enzyme EcoKI specificity protein n=4 Tax=Clostridioides difficile TaxID=1496 RepID=A0A9X8WQ02_CLODI|nr:restriction endonuclease subunit S [Clostridioides difficile]EQG58830.1 type I restriction modification DNA specificity domain protein [Clostridioides difficile DA00149]EQI51625.1 type I restriction modification DNA specificity domain protein [Clostridioides difficile Y184]EQK79907.1 type I restriction modification DNA specificity domain protein [Clostridioides difficile CD127]AMM58442.1 restriction modification system subunit S [Clostridioides difficile]AUA23168.1 restriction endonuclease 
MGYRYRSDDELKDSGVEWLGKIPKDWEVRQLKRVLSDRKENNEPIKTSNILSLTIEKGVIPYSEKGTGGNKAKEDLTQYKLVYPNDIVLNSMNVIVGAVGLSKYFGCASPAYYMLYKINANDDIRFYNYIFKSKLFQDSLKGLGNGIMMKQSETSGKLNTIRMRIPMEKLSSVKIPIAFNLDQEKIANFLDEKTSQFDSIISKKEKLIERLEEAKKSLISEVVTGKVKVVKTDDGYELIKRSSEEMKDSGVEWLGEIPKEWDIKRLRFLGKLQNGISKSSDSFGYGYPFVSYSNVYRNIELPHIVEGLVNSTEEERKIYSVEEGDVFFTRTSETVEEIGFASTCMKTIDNSTFAGFLIRFRPNDKRLYKGFSKYYFRCDLNRKYFVKEMNLVTRASLSQNLLNNLSVVLPKYEEQVEIYNALELKVSYINLSINKLKYQIEKLKEAKQSLISEAVTGKIEILD